MVFILQINENFQLFTDLHCPHSSHGPHSARGAHCPHGPLPPDIPPRLAAVQGDVTPGQHSVETDWEYWDSLGEQHSLDGRVQRGAVRGSGDGGQPRPEERPYQG